MCHGNTGKITIYKRFTIKKVIARKPTRNNDLHKWKKEENFFFFFFLIIIPFDLHSI